MSMYQELDKWFAGRTTVSNAEVPVNDMFVKFGVSDKVHEAFRRLLKDERLIETRHKVYMHINNIPF